jgi:hypothetical protein
MLLSRGGRGAQGVQGARVLCTLCPTLWWLIVFLALVPSHAAAQAAVVDSYSSSLYDLCRLDPICAQGFSLLPQASRLGREKFQHMLDVYQSKLQLSLSSINSTDATMVLALLRQARFCEGKPNQEFRLGRGCVATSDNDETERHRRAARASWEYVSFHLLVAFFVIVVLYSTCVGNEQLGTMVRTLSDFTNTYTPDRPPPAPVLYARPIGDEMDDE